MSDITKMMNVLEQHSAEIIIISDSNSIFISELLEASNLSRYVKKIFTNPAAFNEVIRIRMITKILTTFFPIQSLNSIIVAIFI